MPELNWLDLVSLPAPLVAIGLGRSITRRLDGHRVDRYVHAGLLATGAALVRQAIVRSVAHPRSLRVLRLFVIRGRLTC